jgi:hypothetical protein
LPLAAAGVELGESWIVTGGGKACLRGHDAQRDRLRRGFLRIRSG